MDGLTSAERLSAVTNVVDAKLRRRCANLKREIYEKWESSIAQRGGSVGVSAAQPPVRTTTAMRPIPRPAVAYVAIRSHPGVWCTCSGRSEG